MGVWKAVERKARPAEIIFPNYWGFEKNCYIFLKKNSNCCYVWCEVFKQLSFFAPIYLHARKPYEWISRVERGSKTLPTPSDMDIWVGKQKMWANLTTARILYRLNRCMSRMLNQRVLGNFVKQNTNFDYHFHICCWTLYSWKIKDGMVSTQCFVCRHVHLPRKQTNQQTYNCKLEWEHTRTTHSLELAFWWMSLLWHQDHHGSWSVDENASTVTHRQTDRQHLKYF